ncbi:2-hydroxyacyl-CoA dehydratase subunit D [Sphingomonas soli]|uniref:2-hydroxyacyl-CoA dehydratase subunit D n=1 Tax=Sphingomonas soli TaxID=266127 RepID=UPI0008342A2D|nr:2-hydroxyacyl-CoA dehydratase family protein [Sphingomonas soli]
MPIDSVAAAMERLQSHYSLRIDPRSLVPNGVIGCLGFDVPRELILACGLRPVRLAGNPARPTPHTDKVMGGMGDGETRSRMEHLLSGEFGALSGLVISHDVEDQVRMFYALQELRRVGDPLAASLPQIHFFDLLHMKYRTTWLYNRDRIARLADWLGGIGTPFSDESLAHAIVECNRSRTLLHRLRAYRGPAETRILGSDALAAIGASFSMPPVAYNQTLEALLEGLETAPAIPGPRIFITGSINDSPLVYEMIEHAEGVVVGEDHDWGDRGYDRLVGEGEEDPLGALVDAYQFAPPASAKFSTVARAAYTASHAKATGAEAVIAVIRRSDDAPRWDIPAQREVLAKAGIPLLLVEVDGYHEDQQRAAQPAIAEFIGQIRAGGAR